MTCGGSLEPYTDEKECTLRYLVFKAHNDSDPVASVPWRWLAYVLASAMAKWWGAVYLVDSKTGEDLMGWITAQQPLVLGGNSNLTVSHVRINRDGSTQETIGGIVLVGTPQTTIEGVDIVRELKR